MLKGKLLVLFNHKSMTEALIQLRIERKVTVSRYINFPHKKHNTNTKKGHQ